MYFNFKNHKTLIVAIKVRTPFLGIILLIHIIGRIQISMWSFSGSK
jgi:hypothetical protein